MNANFGFVVVRREVDNRLPFAAGDEVVNYELAEPVPAISDVPHRGHTPELANYIESVSKQMETTSPEALWREESALYCDCRERRKIASILIHAPTGRRWVSPRKERLPAAFRKEGVTTDAWPLHGGVDEGPHVGEVCSCNGCKTLWLLLSTHDEAFKVRIRRAIYGARVAD